MLERETWNDRFDAWREAYDRMSYADQQRFYTVVETEFPNQKQYNVEEAMNAVQRMANDIDELHVLELGGWKGELASDVLSSSLDKYIHCWINFEICPTLDGKSVCESSKFQLAIPPDFFWNVSVPDSNVFISAHCLEHLSMEHVKLLIKKLDTIPSLKWVYIESPLEESPYSWKQYYGSHVLEVGWPEVEKLLEQIGFHIERTGWFCLGFRS